VSLIQLFATILNWVLCTTYGAMRRDWPFRIGNFPGVFPGFATLRAIRDGGSSRHTAKSCPAAKSQFQTFA